MPCYIFINIIAIYNAGNSVQYLTKINMTDKHSCQGGQFVSQLKYVKTSFCGH